jgi:preprotein translocase subunit SecA
MLWEVIDKQIPAKVATYLPEGDERNEQGLLNWINTTFPLGLTAEAAGFSQKTPEEVSDYLIKRVKQSYELKCSHELPEAVKHIERYTILNAIDRLWQEHLYAMDSLREAVYLRAYGQKDPLIEYKTEAYEMFTVLMDSMEGEILHNLFRSTSNLEAFGAFLQNLPQFLIHADETGAQTSEPGSVRPAGVRENPATPATRALEPNESSEPSLSDVFANQQQTAVRDITKVGRNEPCPCGSGKKFKNCCGRNA